MHGIIIIFPKIGLFTEIKKLKSLIKYRWQIIILFFAVVFVSCTQHSTKVPNVVFHNITSYYNAYYLADKNRKDIEATLKKNHVEDFNQILQATYTIDTSKVSSYKKQLDTIEENGGVIIHKHGNSKWVDDAYILIGIGKLYEGEFSNAIKFFKYVNSHSNDANGKHEALAWLMRAYMEGEELFNAKAVSDYMDKTEEKISSKNNMLLSLHRAQYYYINEDYEQMLVHMELAIPHIKIRDEKSRALFIAGQLRQMMGDNDTAYKHYKSVLRKNPPYEFEFYAKLNMAQVSNINDLADVKKIRKYFDKLLADEKNEEFKDRIYYEIAKYDLKQGKIPNAIKNFNLSLKAGTNNLQKAYSYLELGNIYYESSEYEKSKLYYDSIVKVLPKNFRKYDEIKERQEVLTDFVKYRRTIIQNDSLIYVWGSLDSTEREKHIDETIERLEIAHNNKEEKRIAGIINQKTAELESYENPKSKFVFYNPSLLRKAKIDFESDWGEDLPLVDNWRRKNSDNVTSYTNASSNTTTATKKELSANPELKKKPFEIDRNQFYKDAITSEEGFKKKHYETSEAKYNLGKSFYLGLSEPDSAVKVFEDLLDTYPQTKHNLEVMYFLYLICKNVTSCESNFYKDTLLNHYPKSIYARIIENPNAVEESQKENAQARDDYAQAFEYYKRKDFLRSIKLIDRTLKKYPYTDVEDKLKLLRAYNLGNTHGPYEYKKALISFIDIYRDSELRNQAQKDLKRLEKNMLEAKNQTILEEVVYLDDDFKEPHYFMLLVEHPNSSFDTIWREVDGFNKSNYLKKNLLTKKIDLNNSRYLLKISKFILQDSARTYLHHMNDSLLNVNEVLSGFKIKSFIISKSNYQLLIKSKDLDGYFEFYRKKYKQ